MTKQGEPVKHENLVAALAAFQAEVPSIRKGNEAAVQTKTGGGYKYSYADLADVTEKVLPLLGKHGLAFLTLPQRRENGFHLVYRLSHESGESVGGSWPLPDPERVSPQQIGSALTYYRRYILASVTGVAPGGDDDDAQAYRPQEARGGRNSVPVRDWVGEAKNAPDKAALERLWHDARAAGAPTQVMDAIAAAGREFEGA